jgi:hypothetical protein
MKIIREVSNEEMEEKFPDLMSALNSPDADYCWDCDGLRIFKDGACVVCGCTEH